MECRMATRIANDCQRVHTALICRKKQRLLVIDCAASSGDRQADRHARWGGESTAVLLPFPASHRKPSDHPSQSGPIAELPSAKKPMP
jgi:hypothetical protein